MLQILKFSTPTCPPCRALNPIIEEVKKETGADIESINALEDDRAAQYGIKSVPTLIFLKNNFEVNRKIGLISKSDLVALIEQYNG